MHRAGSSRSPLISALSNGAGRCRHVRNKTLKAVSMENPSPSKLSLPDPPMRMPVSSKNDVRLDTLARNKPVKPVKLAKVTKTVPKPPGKIIRQEPEVQPAYNLINQVGVQMLSPALHSQVFPGQPFTRPTIKATNISRKHLESHGLDTELASRLPETNFNLPALRGKSIDEHFYNIGSHMAMPWQKLATDFAATTEKMRPSRPEYIFHCPGWTRYNPDGSFEPVDDLGSESAICFDVETLPAYSPFAVMACAVSETAWYVWISPWLLGLDPSCEHLIPIGDPSIHRVIVGHNVSYDRARILDEYSMKGTNTRFLDTMSLHVACKGITSVQRPTWLSYRKQKREAYERQLQEIERVNALLIEEESKPEIDQERHTNLLAVKMDLEGSLPAPTTGPDYMMNEDSEVKRWEEITSINSLADVARLYCGVELDKSTRNDFLTSTREEIAANIDRYVEYCCADVETTFPPVSLAGVLTMGSAFLPVDQEWENYISSAEKKYQELDGGVRENLVGLAKEALAIYESDKENKKPWEADEWLSQLDWTPTKVGKSRGVNPPEQPPPKKLPKWYIDITKEKPGPTAQGRIIPFLLDMRWKPSTNIQVKPRSLFFSSEHGWLAGQLKGSNLPAGLVLPVKIGDNDELTPIRDKFRFFQLRSDVPTRNILSRKAGGKWIEEGHIVCENKDLTNMALRFCTGTTSNSDWDALRKISANILANGPPSDQEVKTQTSALQLDWKEVQVGKQPPIDPDDMIYWPKWYWDVTAPKPNKERGTANITVRSQIAPLLLRLKWMNYPLFHSRTHGWMYRVPEQDLGNISTTSKPLEFPDEADEKLKTMCQDQQFHFFKLPHKDGDRANVGSPIGKTFLKYSLDGTLSSRGDAAKLALDMNAQCSYWISARDRVLKQVVIWDQQAKVDMGLPLPQSTPPPPSSLSPPPPLPTENPEPEVDPAPPRKYGMILPQVITMGTVTRRAIEKTWLTASNAKPNRIGSELKTLVRAPEGYILVGADVDSEELWIASVVGDAQFGIHGATAIGWMTLEGTKAAGTDLHSKTASILGISRNQAKIFNYSRIYGAGINHAVQLLLQHNASMKQDTAMALAKSLYASTKGKSTYSTSIFGRKFWYGGTESYLFNKLEQIATSDNPRTPALGCGVTSALSKKYLSKQSGEDYMTSRINWVVQSSGVDYLHMLIVAVDYLIQAYDIKARYLISIHDEVRYLAKEEDKYRLALALQIANLWTRSLFAYKLGFDNLPQGVAFFSAVDVDRYLRKEVDMTCVTPSQLIPLPPGESLDMHQILEKTSGGSLYADDTSSRTGSNAELTAPQKPYIAPDVLAHREACEEFLEAQSLDDTSEIKMLARVARSREREKGAELEARANNYSGWIMSTGAKPPVT
ncbi:DNA polymerase gamma 1 [Rhizoctonia solani]|uniref:Mitochondrial DNA polymerase catalytic subunit n=1 Tax=Rhizoctonia solani TaxID=456999 RepID=A0A0K6GGX6_9AGAM|nr:DNA polymerase gamma 1 [Rhizoctonia solani]